MMNKEELDSVLENHAKWLAGDGGARADLRGANLRGVDLRDTNLRGVKLRGADLKWSNLLGARVQESDLRGVDLRWSNLRWTDLRGADLRGAHLRCVDLHGADLNWLSHALLGEILRNAAVTLDQRSVAGVVLSSEDWCWDDFKREFSESQKAWAQDVLLPYAKTKKEKGYLV